ncbi:MAG: adenosine deaminase [Fimbriimonas sp.]
MVSEAFVRQMPKVELHVHLEGSIRPETVLKLAERHGIELPAKDLDGLKDWYTFRDFPHFVQVYVAVSKCVKTAEDVELIAREFLDGQRAQNVLHSEVTYTAATIEKYNGVPWPDQLAALRRAIAYGEQELGITMRLILDIVRGDHTPERALEVAKWAVEARDIVCALGLAGIERAVPASIYKEAFDYAHANGLPVLPHAGETVGPESVREVLDVCDPVRIGHGVQAIQDLKLVAELRDRGIPIEVCPTSNVCIGVYPTFEAHPLPRLMDEGVIVTINSDDPPMFSTTLTDELYKSAQTFDFDEDILWTLTRNAASASLLPEDAKRALLQRLRDEWPDGDEDGE